MQNFIAQIWSLIGLFNLLQNIIPPQLLQFLSQWWFSFQQRFDYYYHLDIPQCNGNYNGANPNEVYEDVELYLASLDAIEGAQRLTVFRAKESSSVEFGQASDEVIEESFKGAKLWWSHHVQLRRSNNQLETRSGPMAHLPNICINHMGGGRRETGADPTRSCHA